MDSPDDKRLSFREFLSSTWWSIKLYWRINPKLATSSIIFGVLVELIQILNTYVFAKVIDILLSVSQGKLDVSWIYIILLVFFLTSVVSTICGLIENYARRMLQTYSYPKFQELLYKRLQQLGIETLEQPKVNNLIARTQQNWRYVEMQFQNITEVVGIGTTLVTTGIIILFFSPHLVPLLVVVSIPYIYFDRKYQKKVWGNDRRLTEERRSAYDSSAMLQTSSMLHELTITGGMPVLEKKFTNFVEKWNKLLSSLRASFYRKIILLRFLRTSVEVYADYLVILRFLAKKMSIGNVTFYIRNVSSFVWKIQDFSDYFSSMYEGSLRVREIKELFEMESKYKDGREVLPILKSGPEITMDDVHFSYPNSKTQVIKGVNLTIKPGEKVAIVGHNGAGKTTLVKLICRFYQVSDGEILANGVNINNLKIASWYKNMGVLFQDYNTYPHLTATENIVIGDIGKSAKKAKIRRAARRADAHNFIKEFEKKYDQILSEKYKGGTRPSTGQWQKIALARFFYRDTPLVIFDEPTAAIDAVSEAKIFNKIYRFFEGKTVIIISHRFSTVRNADRIIVFEKGQVVEQGSHEELMALNATYAKAFRIQAEGYK